MKRSLTLTLLLLLLTVFSVPAYSLDTSDVMLIMPKDLMSRMDRGDDIFILDVRTGQSYTGSPVKIKGAYRIDPKEFVDHVSEIPMGKDIITYCT